MNEGAGWCHLPAPTHSLARQQQLDFFHISGESLLGVRVGFSGTNPKPQPVLGHPGATSTHRTPLTPLLCSGARRGAVRLPWVSLCLVPIPLPSTGHVWAARTAAQITPSDAICAFLRALHPSFSRRSRKRALFPVPGKGWCLPSREHGSPGTASLGCREQTNNIYPSRCSPESPP